MAALPHRRTTRSPEHDLLPAQNAGSRPRRESLFCILDCLIELCLARLGDLAQHRLRHWIRHIDPSVCLAINKGAVDKILGRPTASRSPAPL